VTANAAKLLTEHYVDNFRRLPWRSPPGFPPTDPYRVWLSEVMLQQTTVATVVPRYERFVARWPTIEALAAAPDEQIMQEWAGLGYYARARNLIACAREVARRGGFPTTATELRALPGIGAYTAAAIAAIAFGEKAAVVDTNVERVVARLNAIANPSRMQIEQLTLAMMPADLPRLTEVHFDAAMVTTALALSIAAGVVFGIVPAIQVSGVNPGDSLKDAGRGIITGKGTADDDLAVWLNDNRTHITIRSRHGRKCRVQVSAGGEKRLDPPDQKSDRA